MELSSILPDNSIPPPIRVDVSDSEDSDNMDGNTPLTSTMIGETEADGVDIHLASRSTGGRRSSHEQDVDTHASLVRKLSSVKSLCIQKTTVSREAFFAQAILIYIISIACITNLSLGTGPSNVWVALLSGCLGYLLPEPKIRREKTKSLMDIPKE